MTASSSQKSPFVVDANVFIDAAKKYYAFDLAPKFWESLLAQGLAGRACTIERIADEIRAGQDALSNWIDAKFAPCVKASNAPDTLGHFASLMRWSQSQPFLPAAKAEFASVADAWLVAYAKSVGGIVVTHETFDANCKRRVKIPNACQHLGVQWIDPFEMIRTLGISIS